MHSPETRFNVVTGKGGVGKTLVACLNGMQAARSGKKTLICELNTNETLSSRFSTRPSNGQLVQVSERLWIVNIRPDQALMEYANLKLGIPSISRIVFGNPFVRALTEFVPGMSDLLMFGKAFNHEREVDGRGKPIWDHVIIDAPATGHGLTFLKLPSIIAQAIPTGNMHEEAQSMHALITSTVKTRIDVVTIPEPLPIQETKELYEQLSKEDGLRIDRLIVNRCPEVTLTMSQIDTLEQSGMSGDIVLKHLLEEQRYAHNTRDRLDALAPLELPTIRLPEVSSHAIETSDEKALDLLLERFSSP